MSKTPENCPDRAALDDESKTAFDRGFACGYTSGHNSAEGEANITRLVRQRVIFAAAVGFMLGMVAALFLGY